MSASVSARRNRVMFQPVGYFPCHQLAPPSRVVRACHVAQLEESALDHYPADLCTHLVYAHAIFNCSVAHPAAPTNARACRGRGRRAALGTRPADAAPTRPAAQRHVARAQAAAVAGRRPAVRRRARQRLPRPAQAEAGDHVSRLRPESAVERARRAVKRVSSSWWRWWASSIWMGWTWTCATPRRNTGLCTPTC